MGEARSIMAWQRETRNRMGAPGMVFILCVKEEPYRQKVTFLQKEERIRRPKRLTHPYISF